MRVDGARCTPESAFRYTKLVGWDGPLPVDPKSLLLERRRQSFLNADCISLYYLLIVYYVLPTDVSWILYGKMGTERESLPTSAAVAVIF